MSQVLKLKLALDVIGGGPLVLEVPEPSFAIIFAFIDKLIELNIMSIYNITLNNKIMIVSIKTYLLKTILSTLPDTQIIINLQPLYFFSLVNRLRSRHY